MSQAQPQPRRRQHEVSERGRRRRERPPAKPSKAETTKANRPKPARGPRRRHPPLVPFALGIALGWGMAGPCRSTTASPSSPRYPATPSSKRRPMG